MSFFDMYGEKLVKAIIVHFSYVALTVTIGFIVALLLGILLSRFRTQAGFILPVLSIFQTIPGIVFIGILFLYLGMVPLTVIIALSVYAVFPVLKNTYVGITQVPMQYIEAAKGCGMSGLQALIRVELPIAMPTIIGGLRMSAVYTVSWTVITAMIGLGGLGEFIYIGVNTNNNVLIFAGALPSAIMALCIGLGLDRLQKHLLQKSGGAV